MVCTFVQDIDLYGWPEWSQIIRLIEKKNYVSKISIRRRHQPSLTPEINRMTSNLSFKTAHTQTLYLNISFRTKI